MIKKCGSEPSEAAGDRPGPEEQQEHRLLSYRTRKLQAQPS